jgi:hypothetical protein
MRDRERDGNNEQEQQEPQPAPADNHPSRNDDTLLDDLRESEEPGNLRK